MIEDPSATLHRALADLAALDDDRHLETLDALYPSVLTACERLLRSPATAPGDADAADAVAFVESERNRLSLGEGPPWVVERVAMQTQDESGSIGAAYVMDLALLDIGDRRVDVRDLLRSFLSRYDA